MIVQKDIVIPDFTGNKRATVYQEEGIPLRATILYLHGGALIYGSRKDLPETHINAICSAGYGIVAVDYPLCPEAKLPEILNDVIDTVTWYLREREGIFGCKPGYFLFGRSAGAYLCLLTMRQKLIEKPRGIISYYGYGLLHDKWYNSPSAFYCRYPAMPASCLRKPGGSVHYELALPLGYGTYVCLRQRGEWGTFLGGNDDTLYTLRGFDPAGAPPLFIAHSTGDPDVPFDEYLSLKELFPDAVHYTTFLPKHDFDADSNAPSTIEVLDVTVSFLDANTQ